MLVQEVDEKVEMNKRLMAENEHFVALAHKKENWKEYETLLAVEKSNSRKLLTKLFDKGATDTVDKGSKNTYKDHSKANSNFMSMASFMGAGAKSRQSPPMTGMQSFFD